VVRQLPGHALEQQDPQRVQVGAAVDGALEHAGLLGRGVEQRAGHPVVLRAATGDEAEVDQPGGAVGAHDNVVRLDVAVHQTGAMSRGERPHDVDGQAQHPRLVERAVAQRLRQRAAVDELQNEVGARGDLADLEDLREQRVADAAQQGSLAPNRGQRRRGVAVDPGEQLERVVRALAADTVHHRLGAASEFRDHLEVGERVGRHPEDHRQTCPSVRP
jgi:hypothetical protein